MRHDVRLAARGRKGRMTGSLVTAALAAVFAGTIAGPAGAVAPPTLQITPGPYHNQQEINVSVGPNHFFKPYARINIIECADPGGKSNNLPINVDTCDGNTIQGNTILVQRNGSFSIHGYEVFALPNASQLGETSDTRPSCNQKNMCVLYIGQNQINFRAPKEFSPPFAVLKSRKS